MQYARLLLKIISLNSALKIEFNQFIKFAIGCTSEFEFVMERNCNEQSNKKKCLVSTLNCKTVHGLASMDVCVYVCRLFKSKIGGHSNTTIKCREKKEINIRQNPRTSL